LLDRLRDAGATVTLRNGRPILRAMVAIDSGLLAEAKAARADLVALLSPPRPGAFPATLAFIPPDGAACAACDGSCWWQPKPGTAWRCIACDPWPDGWPGGPDAPRAGQKAPASRTAEAACHEAEWHFRTNTRARGN
jgi:hypothetical protein